MTIFTCRGEWGGEVGVRVSYGGGGGGVDVSLSLNPPDFPGVLRQKTKSEATGIESVLAENRRLPLRLRERERHRKP